MNDDEFDDPDSALFSAYEDQIDTEVRQSSTERIW